MTIRIIGWIYNNNIEHATFINHSFQGDGPTTYVCFLMTCNIFRDRLYCEVSNHGNTTRTEMFFKLKKLKLQPRLVCWGSFFLHVPGAVFQREERPREATLREIWSIHRWRWSVVYASGQPAQYILYCDQLQYRIYCAGWPAVYTTDHLHLSFKSSPASSGRQRTGPPVYL